MRKVIFGIKSKEIMERFIRIEKRMGNNFDVEVKELDGGTIYFLLTKINENLEGI